MSASPHCRKQVGRAPLFWAWSATLAAIVASTGAFAQAAGPCGATPAAAPPPGESCDASSPPPPVPQTWTIIESRSPSDDRPQISASIWVEKDQAILAVRCFDGRMEFMFSPTGLVAPDATARVTYRIEGSAAVTGAWRAAPNRQDLFAPDPERLLRALPDQGTLVLRTTGRAHIVYEASFPYRGMNIVRTRFAAVCVRGQPQAAPPSPLAPASPAPAAPTRQPAEALPLGIRPSAAPPAPPSFANRPLRRLPED
ncbi:hypothetical protein [Roseixanthobacter pseudopolyaromaticivorans]|uniref:hypothetical protein n=1 Tax=Xanthobacteraceae TaxID=335928 RepID=UPI003727E03A